MAIIDLDREQQIELLREADVARLIEVYIPLAESVASRYAQGEDIGDIAYRALVTVISYSRAHYLARLDSGGRVSYRFDTYLTYYLTESIERRLHEVIDNEDC